MNYKPKFLFFFLLFVASLLKAQQYNFHYPESNKDLPQQFIYALAQSPSGHLWVGTGEGIVKFNGQTNKTVMLDGKPCISFCTALLKHKQGMWAGFNDGSLAYTENNGELRSFPQKTTSKIISILSQNNKIIVANQQSIYQVQGKALKTLIKLPNDFVLRQIITLDQNNLLLISSAASYILNTSTGKGQLRKLSMSFESAFVSENKAIALEGSELYRFENGVFSPFLHLQNRTNEVVNLVKLGKQMVLVAEQGLYQVSADGKCNLFNFSTPQQVKSWAISGNELWMGTYGNGLCYFNCADYYVNYASENGATIALVKIANMLALVKANELSIYPKELGAEISTEPTKKIDLNFKATCANKLNNQYLWIGSEQNGIKQLDISTGKWDDLNKINSALPPQKAILAIDFDAKYTWLAVAQNGVYQFDANQNLIKHFNTENGLLHNDIYRTFCSSEGHVWFLSRSSGLAKLNRSGAFEYYGQQEGLASLEFTDITEDENNNTWLTTEGGGLTRIDKKGLIDNFNTQSGLSADYFYGIAHQDKALFFYSRSQLNILFGERLRRINEREIGFTPNFTPRSLVIAPQYLAIAHEKGLLYHYFESIAQANSLKIDIENCLADDIKDFYANDELAYADYKLRFGIEQICLNPYYETELEYKLEGFDKEWLTLTSEELIYQSVKDGDYRLLVREKGKPSNQATFQFTIDAPFWKKPIYYLLALTLISVAVYIIFKIRLSALKARNAELEEKVNERTKALKKKNLELEQFTYAISHDLKNPAINVVELIRILKEDGIVLPEMSEEVFKQLDVSAEKMLEKLLDLIEVLKFANSEELPKTNVQLTNLIDEIKQSIGHSIVASGAEITLDFNAFSNVIYNKLNLYSILYNLISNSVKYCKPNERPVIEISTSFVGGYACITVKDNGLGIDLKRNSDKLFGMFQRIHTSAEGSGIGLHLVKSIVEKNGGEINVESEPGLGTSFIVKLVPQAQAISPDAAA